MAAVTQTTNNFIKLGNATMVTARFTAPLDGDTWATGLRQIDYVSFTIVEGTGAAADAIGAGSVSEGTVTLDVQGTVDSAYALAIGV